MKVRLTKHCDTTDGPKEPGFVIDHPHAHYLVQLKLAEPVPDERPPAPAAETQPAAIAAERVIK
jgi:hypothetical protein